jgi:hypothetical protein
MSLDQSVPLAALQRQVHEILGSACHRNLVAVLGWNGNWHNDITRTLERLHHVHFYEELHSARQLPQRAGYVIYTHCISHNIVRALKRHVPTSPICLRPHQIHDLMRIWWEAQRLRA